MRRFAAVMNHRSAGFKANAMGVWAVPEDQLEEIGPQMAGFAAVSHCYKRPDLRGLAVHRVHDGARPHGQGLRGDDRRDPRRDRRRRVRPALVDQGVQEGAAPLLRPRVGRVARPSTSPPPRPRFDLVRSAAALLAAPAEHLEREPGRDARRQRRPPRSRSSAPTGSSTAGARRRSRGSSPRWCDPAPSRAPAAGRTRRPTGTRGTERPSAGRRRCRSSRSVASARRRTSAGSGGTIARGTSASRSSALEPAVGRDVQHAGMVLAHDERERAHDVVDVHDLERRRRAAHAHPGRAREQLRPEVVRAGAEDRRGAQRRDRHRGMVVLPLGEQPFDLGRVHRGVEAGVRPQWRVLGERERVRAPRAVRGGRREPDDLAHADRRGRVEHPTRPLDVHARHQRFVGDRDRRSRRGGRARPPLRAGA